MLLKIASVRIDCHVLPRPFCLRIFYLNQPFFQPTTTPLDVTLLHDISGALTYLRKYNTNIMKFQRLVVLPENQEWRIKKLAWKKFPQLSHRDAVCKYVQEERIIGVFFIDQFKRRCIYGERGKIYSTKNVSTPTARSSRFISRFPRPNSSPARGVLCLLDWHAHIWKTLALAFRSAPDQSTLPCSLQAFNRSLQWI